MEILNFLIINENTEDFWLFALNMVQLAWNTVKNFAYYNSGLTIGEIVIGFIIIYFIFHFVIPAIFGGSGSDD